MAETTKIKVKNVRAADPQLYFTLHSDDNGTFPAQIQATASLAGKSTYMNSEVQAGGTTADINFDIPFTDANYADETELTYIITIQVPGAGGRGWVPFTGTVEDGEGVVTATHDGSGGADVEVLVQDDPGTTSKQGGGAGAKNKGCLAFLTMLPF
ncbi:MAG: hypothetical protein R3D58_03070 [Saprospiraceae bacterium]|nr:hypothetical protein [Lewinellaceae bacterium]